MKVHGLNLFNSPKTLSLRYKIILITSLIVLFASITISGFSYKRTVQNTLDTAVSGLAGESRLMALRFKNAYEEMEHDLFILSVTPSVEVVVRNEASNSSNDRSSDTRGVSLDHVAGLFSSIMKARPQYTQIRFIGTARNGRELVRVERTPTGPRVVPEGSLQEKGMEPYFQSAVNEAIHENSRLKHSGHSVIFSDVSYNREDGKVVFPRVVTIRAMLPVYNDLHQLVGLIVVNADYAKLLAEAFDGVVQKNRTFVINDEGDYLKYETNGSISDLEFHDNYSKPVPSVVSSILETKISEKAFIDDEDASYFVRVNVNDDDAEKSISVMLQAPLETLLSGARDIRRSNLLLTSAFVLFSLLAAAFASRLLTEPLKKLTRAIIESRDQNSPLVFPITSNDEIGKMATAFQDLTKSHFDSERKLRSIISNIGEGIIMIDEFGSIESYNPACERLFGYTSKEVIGKNVKILMPNPHRKAHDGYLKNYRDTGARKIDWVGREEIGQNKNGTTFPMELTVSELILEGRRLFVGIVRDITERQLVEKAKTEFISTVSHELRTPLTSIMGALRLITAGVVGKTPKKMQEMLDVAYSNSERLARLINDILDVEKINAGQMALTQVPLDLTELVLASIEANKGFGSEYGVAFVCKGYMEPAMVSGDSDRLMQVMANLMSNAAKFSGNSAEVEISIEKSADDRKVRVWVKDNGAGIPDAARATVFDKFTQLDSSDKRVRGGSGLGLGIAKKLVELHGGEIGFVSEVGVGTTFFFDLALLAGGEVPD